MVTQIKPAALVHAIAVEDIRQAVADQLAQSGDAMVAIVNQFIGGGIEPQATHRLETRLDQVLREAGCQVLQALFNMIEPEVSEMPGTVQHLKRNYRRLTEKTTRQEIVTRFGKVSLHRARYRTGRAGKTIFPLEIALGIREGFTPAAADIVGKQFAATGSSQGRTVEMIKDRIGESVGVGKLRKLVTWLADSMEPHRQACQVEQLSEWMTQARKSGVKPVLSVSRDGVSLGIAPWGFFEMASVATVSVLAGGKRLGTVYLGRTPEFNQRTLSDQLTSLLRATLQACVGQLPDVVYVTDAGKVETAYWKNVLRAFFVDGRRIKIHRVVDYYHASERLTKIADALKFGKDKKKRSEWLDHVRDLLLQPGGHGRVLRSIAMMKELYGYKRTAASDAEDAERYLRRYRRFMDYAAMKARCFPIGSGVVESACKQVVSERLKLSGMRWRRDGAQRAMSLRCHLLSGVWDTMYRKLLSSQPPVRDLNDVQAS